MLNFIYAELWRYFHRPAGKAFLILAAGLPVLLSLYIFIGLHWVQMGDIFTQTVGVVAVLMPFAGIFFLVGIVDVSFADELRRATLKNNLAAGVSRPVIYGGKILSGLLLSILHLILALAAFSLSSAALLSLNILEIFDSMGLLLLEVLPLWLGALGLLYLLYFNFRSGLQAVAAVTFGSLFLFPILSAINVPAAEIISQLNLAEWLAKMMTQPMSKALVLECWAVGCCYFAVCAAGGWLFFRRREIR